MVPQIRFVTMLDESLHEPATRLSHSLLLLLWTEMVFPGQPASHISFKPMINTVARVSQTILNKLFTQSTSTVTQHQLRHCPFPQQKVPFDMT